MTKFSGICRPDHKALQEREGRLDRLDRLGLLARRDQIRGGAVYTDLLNGAVTWIHLEKAIRGALGKSGPAMTWMTKVGHLHPLLHKLKKHFG